MSAIGWRVHGDGRRVEPGAVVAPDERLSWPRTIGIGMQHVVAMFGATFLVPLLTGFSPATTLLFSALGTALALPFIVRARQAKSPADHEEAPPPPGRGPESTEQVEA